MAVVGAGTVAAAAAANRNAWVDWYLGGGGGGGVYIHIYVGSRTKP